jgi:hypothetical protein
MDCGHANGQRLFFVDLNGLGLRQLGIKTFPEAGFKR